MPPRSFLVYFLFASDKLTEQSRAQLPAILDSIRRFPAPEVGVVGHTDRVGPAAVNTRLALELAEVIHDVLIAEGIEPALHEVTSHGEANQMGRAHVRTSVLMRISYDVFCSTKTY